VSSDLPPPLARYARPLFLAISAVAFVSLVIVGRAVILPFLLALLLAYVFFPAVRQVERTKLPRWAAILLVYALSIGALSAFGSTVIPRLFVETQKLSNELPKLTQTVRDQWLPAIDAKLQKWTGVDPKKREEQLAAQQRKLAEDKAKAERPPIVITEREDGSLEVHLEEEIELRQQSDGVWLLQPVTPDTDAPFSSARALRDAFDQGVAYAQRNSLELLAIGRAIVAALSRGIFYFFLTLMLAGYMMYTYEDIDKFVRDMWPEHRREAYDRFKRRLDRGLSGVVRGQLLICLVNGLLSAVGFWIFDLKYWPILSLIAAAMSIIPIFGSILSSIPAVAIGLTQSPGTALGVLVWILAIHQLEANFLNPKIIGDQAHIHPVLIVFALLLGEHFFEITGALMAVPALALAQTVFLHFRESVLGIPNTRSSVLPGPSAAAVAAAAALTTESTASIPISVELATPTEPDLPLLDTDDGAELDEDAAGEKAPAKAASTPKPSVPKKKGSPRESFSRTLKSTTK
jgi:predicted PurR-regulated permease PerM